MQDTRHPNDGSTSRSAPGAPRDATLLRAIVESATDYAIFTLDAERRVTSWNVGAENVLGWSAAEAVGQSGDMIFTPEDRARGAPQAETETALAEGRAEDERWHLRRDGSLFWGSGVMMPLRGGAEGFLKILRDRTAERRVEAALRGSEEKYRTLFEAIDEGFCIVEMKFDAARRPIDYRIVEANPAFEQHTGLADAEGKWVSDIAPGLERHWFEIYGRVALTREPERFQNIAAVLKGWYDVYAFPIGAPEAHQVAILFNDITARLRAEAALRESEERFRQFAENSADVLWIVDAETVQLEYLSPAFERIWGERRDAVVGDIGRWAELLHPDDRERAATGMPRLLAGDTFTNEYRIVRPDGQVRWICDTGFPIRDEHGRVRRVAGIAQDVTKDKEHERRQTLLLAELQHRVKNILANIRALSDRTAARSHTLDQFMQAFGGRLDALARTQTLITRSPEGRAALADILAQELAAYDAGNVALSGPDVTFGAQKTQALHFAIHELATNAAKYGAFSADGGRLDVSWEIERPAGAARPRLRLSWRETGVAVPDTAPPRGFGSEIIEDNLPYMLDGEASLVFHRDGVECVIAFPINPKVQGDGGEP